MNTSSTLSAKPAKGFLEVLKDQLNPRLYAVVELCLAEFAPATGTRQPELVSAAKAQLPRLLRDVHDIGPQCIQNAKSKRMVLVIDPEDLAEMLLYVSEPQSLAQAFSDLDPIEQALPEDSARRGQDPFDLTGA